MFRKKGRERGEGEEGLTKDKQGQTQRWKAWPWRRKEGALRPAEDKTGMCFLRFTARPPHGAGERGKGGTKKRAGERLRPKCRLPSTHALSPLILSALSLSSSLASSRQRTPFSKPIAPQSSDGPQSARLRAAPPPFSSSLATTAMVKEILREGEASHQVRRSARDSLDRVSAHVQKAELHECVYERRRE